GQEPNPRNPEAPRGAGSSVTGGRPPGLVLAPAAAAALYSSSPWPFISLPEPRDGGDDMALAAKTASGLAGRATALALSGIAGVALLGGAEAPKGPTVDEVRDLEGKYKAERAAAESAGLTKVFSPEWFSRADDFAQSGQAALAAGRLLEARESFRKARW